MTEEDDEKFEKLLATLLNKDELNLLKNIIKSEGRFEEDKDVQD